MGLARDFTRGGVRRVMKRVARPRLQTIIFLALLAAAVLLYIASGLAGFRPFWADFGMTAFLVLIPPVLYSRVTHLRQRKVSASVISALVVTTVLFGLLMPATTVVADPDTYYLHDPNTSGITPAGEYMNTTQGSGGVTLTFDSLGQKAYWYTDTTYTTGMEAGAYTFNMYFSELPRAWWDANYTYRQRINISAGSSSIPSGYPVKLTFNHQQLVTDSKSQANGDDIRIVYWTGSAWSELDRVLGSGSSWNSASTTILFKTQASIAASAYDTDHYLYYNYSGAVSPPANTPSARYYLAESLGETQTSSTTYASKVQLQFTPSSTSEHWVVVATWRQRHVGSAGSTTELGWSRISINGVVRTGTSQIGYEQSGNAWMARAALFKITGVNVQQTIDVEFRASGGTDAIDTARILAFLIPDATGADIQYGENLARTNDTEATSYPLNVTFTPSSAGAYVWLANGFFHEGPGGSTGGGFEVRDETGTVRQTAEESYSLEDEPFQDFAHFQVRTLTTSSQTFTLVHYPDTTPGSERQGLAQLLFRTDVFDLVESASSESLGTTSSTSYQTKNSLTTATVSSPQDFVYLLSMVLDHSGQNISNSAFGQMRLAGSQQIEAEQRIARGSYDTPIAWASAETVAGNRAIDQRWRSSISSFTAHAQYAHILSLRYKEPALTIGSEEEEGVKITVSVHHTTADGSDAQEIVTNNAVIITNTTSDPLAISVGTGVQQTFSPSARRIRVWLNVTAPNGEQFGLAYDSAADPSNLNTPAILSSEPQLTNPSLNPTTGTSSTAFNFTIDYTHPLGTPANLVRVNVSDATNNTYNNFTMSPTQTPELNYFVQQNWAINGTVSNFANAQSSTDGEASALLAQESSVPTSFPQVAATNTSAESTAVSSHDVSLPTGVVSGDLLIVIFGIQTSSASASATWPSGWTEFFNVTAGTSSVLFHAGGYRLADGSEGSTIVVSTSVNGQSAHNSYRITGAENPSIRAPEAATTSSDVSGSTIDPPSLTPTGGAKDYLWLVTASARGGKTVTGVPANYGNLIEIYSTTGLAASVSTHSMRRELNAVSEDPSTLTFDSAATRRAAATIAVHPKGPILQASATASTTTTSTSYVLMDSMSLTPAAGDYLAVFSTSVSDNTAGTYVRISIFVNGVQQAHTEREQFQEGSIVGSPYAIATHANITVGAGQTVEVRWLVTAGTGTAYTRTLNLFPVDPADVSQATATSDDTLASATYTLLGSMTLTPGVGDYLLLFSTSADGPAAAQLAFAVFVNGAIVQHTERTIDQESSIANTEMPVFIAARVSPMAGQAVEIRWARSAGTGTITAHERTLTLFKTDLGNVLEVSATSDTSATNTADALLSGMSLTPGTGTYLALFSDSHRYGIIGSNINTSYSIYVNGAQIPPSERISTHDSSIDNADIAAMTNGAISPGSGQTVEVRWRASATDSRTSHERTFVLLKAGASAGISLDNVSSASGTTSPLTFSHTVGSGSDRLLVVSVAVEDSPANADVTALTYNSVSLTKAVDRNVGTGTDMNVELWYMLDANLPSTGSYTVSITTAGAITDIIAGAVSVTGAAQQAPEATASNDDGGAGNEWIETQITTTTNGSWVFDVVGIGDASLTFTANSGQAERYDLSGISSASASGNRPVPEAGTETINWTVDGTVSTRIAHALAAFAPAALTTGAELLVQWNTTGIRSTGEDTLVLRYNLTTADDTFGVWVWSFTSSDWTQRGTLDQTSQSFFNYTLTTDEKSGGVVRIRLNDTSSSGTTDLSIDYQLVKNTLWKIGVTYYYNTTLSAGWYDHFFWASDTNGESNKTTTFAGPSVTAAPSISNFRLENATAVSKAGEQLDVDVEYFFIVNVTDASGWTDIGDDGSVFLRLWYDGNTSSSTTRNPAACAAVGGNWTKCYNAFLSNDTYAYANQTAWYGDWSYRKKVTIDSTKVAGDLANFPVLIRITDTDLRDDAQNDGDDILFTASDGTTKLNHEIELFNGTTGELVAWVNVTSLPSSVDTDIYMYYGNVTATNQENLAGTWDANYAAVWHLDESPTDGVAGHEDSTSNNNDGTPQNFTDGGGGTTNANGIIDGADDFGGDDDYVDVPSSASLDITGDQITLEAWIRLTSTFDSSATQDQTLIDGGGAIEYWLDEGDGSIHFSLNTGGWLGLVSTQSSWTGNVWYHLVAVYNGTDRFLYVNGSQDSTVGDTGNINSNVFGIHISNPTPTTNEGPFDGVIDEVRISNVGRTSAWVLTTYNNRNDSAFYSVGSEEGLGNDTAWSSFGFTLDPSDTINKVEVGVEWFRNNTAPILNVSMSWDGGMSWAANQTPTNKSSDDDALEFLDFTSATSWTASKLADANLRVRAKTNASGARLDHVTVRVNVTSELTFSEQTTGANYRIELKYQDTSDPSTASLSEWSVTEGRATYNASASSLTAITNGYEFKLALKLGYQVKQANDPSNSTSGGYNDINSWNAEVTAYDGLETTTLQTASTGEHMEFGVFMYTFVNISSDWTVTLGPGDTQNTNTVTVYYRSNDDFRMRLWFVTNLDSGSDEIDNENVAILAAADPNDNITSDIAFKGLGEANDVYIFGSVTWWFPHDVDNDEGTVVVQFSVTVAYGTPDGTYTAQLTIRIVQVPSG